MSDKFHIIIHKWWVSDLKKYSLNISYDGGQPSSIPNLFDYVNLFATQAVITQTSFDGIIVRLIRGSHNLFRQRP